MTKKILRINMTDLSATYEDVPEKWSRWAGRGLTSAITCDEVDPLCHPLGPNNKLVIAPGWVTGTPAAPSSGRTSFGGKSPPSSVIKYGIEPPIQFPAGNNLRSTQGRSVRQCKQCHTEMERVRRPLRKLAKENNQNAIA